MKKKTKKTVTIPKEEYEHLKSVKEAYMQELKNKIQYDNQQIILQEQQSRLSSIIGYAPNVNDLIMRGLL